MNKKAHMPPYVVQWEEHNTMIYTLAKLSDRASSLDQISSLQEI